MSDLLAEIPPAGGMIVTTLAPMTTRNA